MLKLKYKHYITILFASIFLLFGCRSKQGIVIESSTSNKAMDIPENPSSLTLPQNTIAVQPTMQTNGFSLETNDLWSGYAFLLDPYGETPYEAGIIYTTLPDQCSLRIRLRWTDRQGLLQGQIQYANVKNAAFTYEFNLPSDINPQYVMLDVQLRLDNDEFPQKESILKLFGEHGEALSGQSMVEREDGGRMLIAQWNLSYPNEALAFETALSRQTNLSFVDVNWVDGMLILTSDTASIENSEECTTLIRDLLVQALGNDSYQDPLFSIINIDDEVLLSSGHDPYVVIPVEHGVYITDGGTKYHEENCRYASGSEKIPLSVATLRGYSACKICH